MVKSRRKAAFCSVNPPIPGISRTCSHCECQDVKLGFTSQGGASASPKVWTSFHIFSGMGCRMLPFMKEQGHHCSMFISPFRSEGMDPSLSIFSQFLTLISTDFVFFHFSIFVGILLWKSPWKFPTPQRGETWAKGDQRIYRHPNPGPSAQMMPARRPTNQQKIFI